MQERRIVGVMYFHNLRVFVM